MTSDGLYLYNRFDDWTKRTGILDGSGLTWVARLPINLLVVVVSLVAWAMSGKAKEVK